ncbi:hypothetical protein MKX03_015068, partial [Papaver bracteatum]
YYVKSKELDGISRYVEQFILNLHVEVEKMFIPMNYITKDIPSGSHWTLLEYDFFEGEWNFFNSLSIYKVKCKHQAVQMETTCMPYLIQRYDNLKLSAEFVDIKR